MILAIDPGPAQCGWCLYEPTARAVHASGIAVNAGLLAELGGGAFVEARLLAIEWLTSYGMPVGAEVFATCRWVGRFEQVAAHRGLPIRLLPRVDVKLHLCGTARAKDANVRQSLLDRIGPPGTKKARGPTYGVKSHAWAALAVAVTAAETKEKP